MVATRDEERELERLEEESRLGCGVVFVTFLIGFAFPLVWIFTAICFVGFWNVIGQLTKLEKKIADRSKTKNNKGLLYVVIACIVVAVLVGAGITYVILNL